MSRPGRRIVLAIGALVLSLAIGAAYRGGYLPGFRGEKDSAGRTSGGEGEGGGRSAPVSVTTAPARVSDVPVTIDAVGTVQALNTVTVRTQVDGRLLRLDFTEGQDVRKDDIIAEIDPALYRAQYEQALAKKAQDEANLANARVDLERYKRLVAGKFLSQQQYTTQKALVQQLEAQVRADQAAIDSAKTTLDYATIRAPIDGRAGIRLVDVGNILRASDQNGIVVLTQIKPIYVMFTLPQQSLAAVQKSKRDGEAHVLALGQDNASTLARGELAVVDNQIDQLTGTVRLKAVFDNEDLSLWPGQFVNVRLMLETIKQAVVTPSPAVQRGPTGAFVYVLGEDGLAHMRPVTTGRQDESLVVILTGLKPDETVIVSGFSRLSDGAKVRVIDNGGPGNGGGRNPAGQGRPGEDARGEGRPR
jgi:multidrug efflux system membrane fusion protein